MDIQAIRQKTDRELQVILTEQRALLEDLRFRVSARELKNVREIPQTRRTIARIMTILNERESGIPKGEQAPFGAGRNQESGESLAVA